MLIYQIGTLHMILNIFCVTDNSTNIYVYMCDMFVDLFSQQTLQSLALIVYSTSHTQAILTVNPKLIIPYYHMNCLLIMKCVEFQIYILNVVRA